MSSAEAPSSPVLPQTQDAPMNGECLSCRVIGTGALAAVGVYALDMSRAHKPGSVMGKRIMGGVGVLFLLGSYGRWNAGRGQP